ncbi:MAG: rhodanese-like domain-containing protein [Bacteroidetes bacterium]|nr:rhodanese-like domain-containing protein [Bacteroidota bacterium]
MFDFFSFKKKATVDIKALIDDGAPVIDVRTPGEFSTGHVKDSINIPLREISRNVDFFKKQKAPIITVCHSGARSGMAASQIKRLGLEAYNGGAWTDVDRLYN